jgi:hypothetical protein
MLVSIVHGGSVREIEQECCFCWFWCANISAVHAALLDECKNTSPQARRSEFPFACGTAVRATAIGSRRSL